MMCMITELELELRFGLNERAKYVWAILREWSDDARDVYDRFYLHDQIFIMVHKYLYVKVIYRI